MKLEMDFNVLILLCRLVIKWLKNWCIIKALLHIIFYQNDLTENECYKKKFNYFFGFQLYSKGRSQKKKKKKNYIVKVNLVPQFC